MSRWAYPPTSPIAARRSSMPSACGKIRRQVLYRDTYAYRGRRPGGNRGRIGAASPGRIQRCTDLPKHAGCRRRLRGAPGCRRRSRMERRDSIALAACGARNSQDHYRAFAQIVNEQSERLLTIRGMFRLKTAEEDGRKPVPLEEVEPAKNIVQRFSTGAMSFGSISHLSSPTTGHCDEPHWRQIEHRRRRREADRFKPLPNGDSMRSAIKQVASGRFGVTAEYLVNST